jgi:hypothetical protein
MTARQQSRPSSAISAKATLLRPASTGKAVTWTFLRLPKDTSKKLPSRGQVSVDGTLNRIAFQATLEPDGEGGHWLKVPKSLRLKAAAEPGDVVALELSPVVKEPEPKVPADLRQALTASPTVKMLWSDLTPMARRDWIHWIVSAKQAVTRERRIATACSMLAAGKRRPCCFDRSGMYAKSLRCPVAADEPSDVRRMSR